MIARYQQDLGEQHPMKKIVVTGGSGKVGRALIRDLIEHGYSVINIDLVPSTDPLCHFLKADLNDMGQAVDALRRAAGTVERRRPRGCQTP
jgi:nucleoside-diphosphate-sugar epimerase